AILDPVARLPVPLEISSVIFMRCLPETPEPDSTTAPMIFLNVCQLWSHIALSTPSLWPTIHIRSPRAKTFDRLFVTWMERAPDLPVTLSLVGSLDRPVQVAVKEHAHRLQNIELSMIYQQH
ncbi:hypothetical protein FB451DRAFT_1023389, partial [Mycena latifolia]